MWLAKIEARISPSTHSSLSHAWKNSKQIKSIYGGFSTVRANFYLALGAEG